MKSLKSPFIFSSFVYTFILIGMTSGIVSAQTCEDWVARVVSVQGIVTAQKAGQDDITLVKLDQTFSKGDRIFVGEKSRAAVVLCNEAVLRLDQNTSLTLKGMERERTTLLDLFKGAIHFFSREPKSLKVSTPFVNGTVEGTEFLVKVDIDAAQTFMFIFEGKVAATNEVGSLLLSRGQSALIQEGKAPVLYPVVRPRDAVQWALYYPPIIDFKAGDFSGAAEWETKVKQSINSYWEGNLPQAFEILEDVPEDIQDQRFFVYRAGILLTVGQVDEAKADIEKALSIDANDSSAVSLQSLIAVVQNEKKQAMDLAKKAVELNPQSLVARIALSYAQQAHFNIQQALESVQEAVKVDAGNALARARLAELWLSLGYLDKALVEAKKAADLKPNLARIQSVLGFAYLTQIKTEKAKKAFEKAIILDQAAPLPRLGLGLAKIRDGDLKEGRKEIEIAAALDVNNALIRSYLGKAYFEEKRGPKDGDQFKIAQELDPNDPTPYFYDAIRKQTENRPVEALKDIQKSIELNNNRAVYRSKLLLDQDLAARSASLGRIYRDLGFEQLALVEGWKSVNTDPSNYSAHRFLADTYSTLPRHEIARVSELLQSQLLQPININPIQPSLAESDLLALSGAGPSDPAFNEFNPLFNRNRLALQANVVAGENDTVGDDFVLSGVKDWFSISAGQNYYKTDGFRENNDLERQLYNVFAQASVNYKTSIQAEYRYKDQEYGDLPIRFDPDNFFPTERRKERINSIRVGLHHAFSPNSDLIGYFTYREYDDSTVDTDPIFPLDFQTDEVGYMGEIQHLFNWKIFNIIAGVGYFDSDTEDTISFFPLPTTISESNLQHTNIYAYPQINYPDSVIWTLGGSGDFFRGLTVDTDQFNPKFGVTWTPLSGTTFRGAVFRTLKRSLISNQTLEPTQVAGFNQFFDDADGVEAWRYGAALDQKLPISKFAIFGDSSLFGGFELSKRELDVPFTVLGSEVRNANWDEYNVRTYANWAFHDWFAFRAEYQYEKFERDSDVGSDLFTELKTHRLPLGVNFFHPIGISVGFKATYIDQSGEFGNPNVSLSRDDDQFWVIDASLSHRLPKRYGLITLEVRNLFDEEFNFQDTDASNPSIQPDRMILGRIVLSF